MGGKAEVVPRFSQVCCLWLFGVFVAPGEGKEKARDDGRIRSRIRQKERYTGFCNGSLILSPVSFLITVLTRSL